MYIMCYIMLAQRFEPQAEVSRTVIIMEICQALALHMSIIIIVLLSSSIASNFFLTLHSPSFFLKDLFAQPRILASSVFLGWAERALGDRPFQCIAPVLWNSLPLSVRHSSSLSSFKSDLKTHLFSCAY